MINRETFCTVATIRAEFVASSIQMGLGGKWLHSTDLGFSINYRGYGQSYVTDHGCLPKAYVTDGKHNSLMKKSRDMEMARLNRQACMIEANYI